MPPHQHFNFVATNFDKMLGRGFDVVYHLYLQGLLMQVSVHFVVMYEYCDIVMHEYCVVVMCKYCVCDILIHRC